jgi:hypothetical protein
MEVTDIWDLTSGFKSNITSWLSHWFKGDIMKLLECIQNNISFNGNLHIKISQSYMYWKNYSKGFFFWQSVQSLHA